MDATVAQSEIPGVYDSLAKTYDIWGKLAETRARNRAIELADIKDGQHILEVAVGTGLGFYEIVGRNPSGTNIGVDISPGMLLKAEKRLGKLAAANYELKIGNAFSLEAESECVDLLVNNYMFDLIAFDDMDTWIQS
jgi:ubiquinone/menaquinone biosynthesis C-methylase UbiE